MKKCLICVTVNRSQEASVLSISCVCVCVCIYQSHGQQSGVCPADIVINKAAASQQLHQLSLYVLSITRLAVLDQRLAAPQEGVHTGRVHTHTLLEGLQTHMFAQR